MKAAACYYIKKDEQKKENEIIVNTFSSLDFYSKEKSWRFFTSKNFDNIGTRKSLHKLYQEEKMQYCKTLECNFTDFSEVVTSTGKACFPNLALMPNLRELILDAPPQFTSIDERYLQGKLVHFK